MLKRFLFARRGDEAFGKAVVVDVLDGVPIFVLLLLHEAVEVWLQARVLFTFTLDFLLSFALGICFIGSWTFVAGFVATCD